MTLQVRCTGCFDLGEHSQKEFKSHTQTFMQTLNMVVFSHDVCSESH